MLSSPELNGGIGLLEWQAESPSVLADLAEQCLRNSPYLALRRIACLPLGHAIVLRGCLPTYYLKQMAQSLVSQVPGVEQVQNEIEVVTSPQQGRHC